MKRLLIIIAILFASLLATISCGVTKKVALTKESQVDSLVTSSETLSIVDKAIDTTKTEQGKVVITEIEFYPPTSTREPENDKPPDNSSNIIIKTTVVELDNIGKVQGDVKSIRQTIIEQEVKQKGETKEYSEAVAKEDSSLLVKHFQEKEKIKESKSKAPTWIYIACIVFILALCVFLYFKKTSIIGWFKRIFKIFI